MDRDEQGGQLQLPVLHHQMQQVVGLGVIGNPDVLENKNKYLKWIKKNVL